MKDLFRIISHRFQKNKKQSVSVLAIIITFVMVYSLIMPAVAIERDAAEKEPGMTVEGTASENVTAEAMAEGEPASLEAEVTEEAAVEEPVAEEAAVEEPVAEEIQTESAAPAAAPAENNAADDSNVAAETSAAQQGANTGAAQENTGASQANTGAAAQADANQANADSKADSSASDTKTSDAEEGMPAQNFEQVIKYKEIIDEDGNTVDKEIKVVVDAAKDTFPAGTTMKAELILDNADVEKAVEAAVKQAAGELADATSIVQYRAVDITFADKDGQKVEPAKKVEVRITSDKIAEIVNPLLVHVNVNDQNGRVINADVFPKKDVSIIDEKPDTIDDNENTMLFKASRFSPYVIVESQTIDEDGDAMHGLNGVEENADNGAEAVNGENGDGVLIAESDSYTVTIKYDEAANIPEDAEIDIKEIPEASRQYQSYMGEAEKLLIGDANENGENASGSKEINYAKIVDVNIVSATEGTVTPEADIDVDIAYKETEEIAEGTVMQALSFNGRTPEVEKDALVYGGETHVDGLQVTTDKLPVYGIVGTETISADVITHDGATYKITVTYGDDAKIPTGATLVANEIEPDTAEWQEYYNQAVKASDKNAFAFARFFDIRIMDGDKEIEPQAPVTTTIEYDSALPLDPGSDPKAVHFADNGIEIIDVAVDDEEYASEFTFEQGSFSVTGTVVSELAEGQYLIYGYNVTYNNGTYHDKSYTNTSDWAYKNVTAFSATYRAMQYNNGLGVNSDMTAGYGRARYTGNNNSRVLWTVTKSEDGYLISNGGRYLRDNNGTLTTTTNVNDATVWSYSNGQLSSGSRYLAFNGTTFYLTSTKPVGENIYMAWQNPQTTGTLTVHYMKDNGDGTYTESSQTTVNLTGNLNRGDQYDLRQGIPSGMQYQKTVLADSSNFDGSGTEIHYFLQTNYNVPNNDDIDATYRGWLYRETTTWDYDYGVAGWPSNGGIAVSSVSAYRTFGDEKDVYVVYREAPASSGTVPDVDDPEAPKVEKNKIDNENGTYDLELSVTGSASSASATSKANVAVVLDLSYSMLASDTGVSGQSRLDACKDAVQSLATQLLALNESNPGTVEMAYIGFAQRVLNEREINNTYFDLDSFMTAVNKSTTAAGTNWDAALEAVNNIQWSDGDPLYVIFVTDGEPNGYSNKTIAGQSNNGTLWDSGNYNIGNQNTNVNNGAVQSAKAQINQLKAEGATIYGIGAFITSGNPYFVDQINIDSDKHFRANNTAALNEKISQIVGEVSNSVGYQKVEMTDGITGMTSTALVNGNAGNFRYEIAKYNFDSNGKKTTKIEGTEATITVNNDGTLTAVFPDGTSDTLNQASYNETTKQVEWKMGDTYQLRDGYTYDVKFSVWPSQVAYDLVADLNNGIATWDTSTGTAQIVYGADVDENVLPESGKRVYDATYTDQIKKNGDSYSLKTNVDSGNVVTYTKIKTITVNGQTTTTREDGESKFINPDPMPLTGSESKITKKWNVDLQKEQLIPLLYDTWNAPYPAKMLTNQEDYGITFQVMKGDDNYKQVQLGWNAATSDYKWADETTSETIYGITKEVGTLWEESFALSTGILLSESECDEQQIDKTRYNSVTYTEGSETKTYYVLDSGRDYYVEEPTLDYHFDTETKIYHPMLVDGKLKNVTISGNTVTDIEDMSQGLLVENTLRGGINLNKVVQDDKGNEITSNQKFEFTISLHNDKENTFEGDNAPWYTVNGKDYHDEEGNYYAKSELVLKDGHYYVSEEEDAAEAFGNELSTSSPYKDATATAKILPSDSLRIVNVPAGTTYSIVESEISGSELKAIDIVIKLNDDDDGQAVDGADLSARTASGEIVPNRQNNVTFTNIIKEVDVKFYKVANDKIKIDQNTNKVDLTVGSLSGAEFDLYNYDSVNKVKGTKIKSIIVGNNGIGDLGKLLNGTYALVETKAPDGYNLLTNDVIITVDAPSVTYKMEDTNLDDNGTGIITDNGTVTIVVPNTTGYELPHTGGPGTLPYTLGGVALIMASALMYGFRMRRRERRLN